MLEDTIGRLLETAGIAPGPGAVSLLARHVALVLEANRTMNLTRIDDEESAARLHVLDSLTALGAVQAAPAGRMADIGSGAGFPGIPLAVVTGRPSTLIESRGRKAAFLKEATVALGLAVDVEAVRAEELALAHPGEFAVVVARALSELPAIVELASPLLSRGGRLIAMKGSPSEEETGRGQRAARLVGMRELGAFPVRTPGIEEARTILVYEKVGPPSVRLPRRPGDAQRRPLA